MAISPKLRSYMNLCGAQFEEVSHAPARQAARAAQAAHIPGQRVAKAVLVRVGDGFMLVVVPSSRHVQFDALQRWIGREATLATEDDSLELFPDCVRGAIPPIGNAFGLETIIDDELNAAEDVFFEGGDHETLVHVDGATWRRLMRDASHNAFSA